MLAPHGLRIDTDKDAGPALSDRMIRHRPQHRVPPSHRRRHSFCRKSFSTTLSSMTSAICRFNFAFYSSNCLRRLVSDRSVPPYLAFRLQNDAGLRLCLRHSSAVGKTSLLLLNHPDNLRFGETAFPHVVCSFRLGGIYIMARELSGLRSLILCYFSVSANR
jgi:hypothetical protein